MFWVIGGGLATAALLQAAAGVQVPVSSHLGPQTRSSSFRGHALLMAEGTEQKAWRKHAVSLESSVQEWCSSHLSTV